MQTNIQTFSLLYDTITGWKVVLVRVKEFLAMGSLALDAYLLPCHFAVLCWGLMEVGWGGWVVESHICSLIQTVVPTLLESPFDLVVSSFIEGSLEMITAPSTV